MLSPSQIQTSSLTSFFPGAAISQPLPCTHCPHPSLSLPFAVWRIQTKDPDWPQPATPPTQTRLPERAAPLLWKPAGIRDSEHEDAQSSPKSLEPGSRLRIWGSDVAPGL